MSLTRRILIASAIATVALPGPLFAQAAFTPSPGSPVRKAIMDAMRAVGEDKTRVFVVRRLRVANGWAWLEADPQSRDGRGRYESESALLRQVGARWTVVAQPCAEVDCNTAQEMRNIRQAFPGAPASIFP